MTHPRPTPPPWNAGGAGRRFRIGEPQDPTVRSRSPVTTRGQTRAEPPLENTTDVATSDNGQITAAEPPSQDETEHPVSEMEQIVAALNLVGTNRYNLISLELATALETVTGQIQAQEQDADSRTDTLRRTIDSVSTRLEAAVLPIDVSIKDVSKKLEQHVIQNAKTLKSIAKNLRDITKKQKELESDLRKQKAKLDALGQGGQNLQTAMMDKLDKILLATDRSLGEVSGKDENFFVWLWKALATSPWNFLSKRSGNQIGFLFTKAF